MVLSITASVVVRSDGDGDTAPPSSGIVSDNTGAIIGGVVAVFLILGATVAVVALILRNRQTMLEQDPKRYDGQ